MNTQQKFLQPLEPFGTAYRQAPPSVGAQMVPYESLSAYIQNCYETRRATVFLNGTGYDVAIYVPMGDVDDMPYVIVNSNMIPLDGGESEPKPDDVVLARIEREAAAVTEQCYLTESPFPSEQESVKSGFIFPALVRWYFNRSGLSYGIEKREVTMRDIMSEPRAILLGPPGSGKTTVLRYIALRFSDMAIKGSGLAPVYIQLRNTNFKNADPLCGYAASGDLPQRVWILDGLDEIEPNSLSAAKMAIAHLIRSRTRDRIFICSRHSSYDGFLMDDCAHYELQPFSEMQSCQWIHERLSGRYPSQWRELIYHLKTVPELQVLASNPLLLSVLVHHYIYGRVVPQQRGELLSRFVDMLCSDWDGARGFTRGTVASLAPHRRADVLAWLAFEMKAKNENSFSSKWLAAQNLPPAVSGRGVEEWLSELEAHTGIISHKKYPTDRWEFSHGLIQDYLAARHLVSRTGDVEQFLIKQAGGDNWHDIWLLACGEATDASELLQQAAKSRDIREDIKALLFAGTIAQGVQLEKGLAEYYRNLLASEFEKHSARVEVKKYERYPERHSLVLLMEKGPHVGFIQRLLSLLHRARWWSDGRSVAQILQREKRVGVPTAEMCSHDGWSVFTTVPVIGDPSKIELKFEVLENISGE